MMVELRPRVKVRYGGITSGKNCFAMAIYLKKYVFFLSNYGIAVPCTLFNYFEIKITIG